jgi:outer membrane protein assembly factor BamB
MRQLTSAALISLAVAFPSANQSSRAQDADWRQWGGPNRDFTSDASGLANSWPVGGPPVLWSRPLGLGHSAITVDEGRLYTMYRPGEQISKQGPWQNEEVVISMDAATGKTLWEHRYPSEPADFSYGVGPHATPLVAGSLVFTAGTRKVIHAFDKGTGRVVWSHDLVKEYGATPLLVRAPIKSGYAASPLAYNDTIIVTAGGPGQAVMAFRQNDGRLLWKGGDFLIGEASPILIDVNGQTQLVVLGGQTVNGLDPSTGAMLWSHPHDTDMDMNNSTPNWGADNILFISSAYNQGARGLRLARRGGKTIVDELWFNGQMQLAFQNAVRVGGYIYGAHGNLGPAFFTAVDVRTGRTMWRHRGFGKSSFIYADGKAIILDEDGDLALATLSPEGLNVLSEVRVFDTVSWTVPTLVGTTLYARDREKIVAIDVGAPR